MAKSFAAASSQYFSATAAPITALPCTLAAWAFHSTSANKAVVSLDTTGGNPRVALQFNTTPNVVAVQTNSAGTSNSAVSAGIATVSTWLHAAAVFTSNTSRTAYLNGVAGTTDTTSNTFTAPDTVRVGATVVSAALANYMNGRIAEVGVWNVALTTAEIEMLAAGVSPLLVRPSALVFYAPALDNGTNLADWAGGLVLTPTNAPTDIDHPPGLAYLSVGSPIQAFSAGTPAPTISSTNNANTLIDEASFVITGTNLTSATAVTFKQTNRPDYNATAFITGNDATTATLTGLDVQDMGFAYGAATVEVTTAGGTSSPFSITIAPQATHTHITLASTDAGVEWLGLTSVDGDQRVAATTTAKGGTFAFVGTDGNYTITYAGDAPTNDSIYWGEFDDSDDQWYEAIVAINPVASGSSAAILGMMRHRDRRHLRQR